MVGNAITCCRKNRGQFSDKGKTDNINKGWLNRKRIIFILNAVHKKKVLTISIVTLRSDSEAEY